MKKKILNIIVIIFILFLIILITILLNDNIKLREKISENKKIYEIEDNYDTVPNSESDFIYVNNGSEVQINGYQGKGGNIVMPDEIDGSVVTRIATKAFETAENITEIVLPKKLEYIGDNAFYGLKNLKGTIIIPETVTEINDHAFQSTGITGLVIKSNCKIKLNAFSNLDNLSFIYVKEGCSPKIAKSTFSYAKSLTIAIFPESITDIKDDTFDACNKMIIYTPKNSFAEEYANRNFIKVNSDSYEEQVNKYSSKY